MFNRKLIFFSHHLVNNSVEMSLLKGTCRIIDKCYKSKFSTACKPAERMTELLKLKFPQAKSVEVVDVSGGCGSMYEIFVESVEFKGLSTIKQHRLINEILKEDIKQMHGLRILTKIPDEKG